MGNLFGALIVQYHPIFRHKRIYDETISWLERNNVPVLVHDNTKRNIGLSKARNLLLKKATADAVILMDFDIRFRSVDFEAMAEKALESDVGLVMPAKRGGDTIKKNAEWQPIEKPNCHCMVMERKLLLDMGGFDEKYFAYMADLDLLNRLREKELQLLQHNESYIVYHFGLSTDIKNRNKIHAKDEKLYQQKRD